MARLIITLLLASIGLTVHAQRKVLLEGYVGAHYVQCPMGDHYMDSMVATYPNSLIVVALHAYSIPDAMNIPAFDTLQAYTSGGAPLGCIDRKWSGAGTYAALFHTQWPAKIQERMAIPPEVSINVATSWNATTRAITANVTGTVLADLPTGDYRLNVYIVEDSVTGTGAGYDQANIYDQQSGNPFYGLGDPIIGFIHRRVVRAVLPAAWGLAGAISTTPMQGQTFNQTFTYSLPANYNENRVSVAAFATALSGDHLGDTVLNANQEKLQLTASVPATSIANGKIVCYPNPSHDQCTFEVDMQGKFKLVIHDVTGWKILDKEFTGTATLHKYELPGPGIYTYTITDGKEIKRISKISFY